ncbi:MAG: hypothetical protein JWL86_1374 [Rhizobium sp.]|nr:hypothetical protein [Rhizobium sp.]
MKKIVLIALFVVLAVIRLAGHSLFHGGTVSRPAAHITHQTSNDIQGGKKSPIPDQGFDIA